MKNSDQGSGIRKQETRASDQGFMLLGLIVAIAIILITLSVAAPVLVRSLRRDREVEAVHRGNQYTRAIQLYYRQFHHYPGSIEQLEKTNNIRFLRQRYLDPIDGKNDWRTIAVGTNKTTVKGFFGQPLAGLATTGVGSVSNIISPGIGMGAPGIGTNAGTSAAPTGAVGAAGTAASPGTPGIQGTPGASASPGGTDTSSTSSASSGGVGGSTTGSSGSSIAGATSPTANGISGGPLFMGVGLGAPGDSITELNEQTSYATWEFLYDPRIELLKAQAGLNGAANSINPGQPGTMGAPGATGAPGIGAPAGIGTPGTTAPTGTGTPGTTPTPQL